MTRVELLEKLNRKPAVHQLTYGAFIQETLFLDNDIIVVPLQALGFQSEANYLAYYSFEIGQVEIDNDAIANLVKQGERANPVVAIVKFLNEETIPEELENEAIKDLLSVSKILSWTSGDQLRVFGYLTTSENTSHFRLTPPNSKNRIRLGFGNTGEDYVNQIKKILDTSKNDEHFAYALSILNDANFEQNPKFQIARFFNCLECLSYKLKKHFPNKTRKAVKYLLGLEDGVTSEVHIDGKKYRYDVIEIAGRIRDKYFHGLQLEEGDLNAESKHVYELFDKNPEQIASVMQSYCELEIARWANGVSNGLSDL